MRPWKRACDLLWAVLGLTVLSPLFLVIAVAVKLQDTGPVFFRQTRVGYRGQLFRLWKFRTMVPDGAARGPAITIGRDPRLTRVGAWLRRLKLDELPQLFNVLAGDMSLVGPRPEVPHFVALYDAEQRKVLELVPGLTDAASLRYRDESTVLAGARDAKQLYVETVMPEKIRLSLAYASHATPWSDVRMIVSTLRLLFSRSGTAEPVLEVPPSTSRLTSRIPE